LSNAAFLQATLKEGHIPASERKSALAKQILGNLIFHGFAERERVLDCERIFALTSSANLCSRGCRRVLGNPTTDRVRGKIGLRLALG